MEPRIIVVLGIFAHLVHLLGAGLIVRRRADAARGYECASFWAAGLATLVPLVTLGLFAYVFVIGRSSSVAQLAGEDGFRLWSLWCEVWPILFFANPLSGILSVMALAMPPYSLRAWPCTLSRAGAVTATGLGCYTVLRYFPDA